MSPLFAFFLAGASIPQGNYSISVGLLLSPAIRILHIPPTSKKYKFPLFPQNLMSPNFVQLTFLLNLRFLASPLFWSWWIYASCFTLIGRTCFWDFCCFPLRWPWCFYALCLTLRLFLLDASGVDNHLVKFVYDPCEHVLSNDGSLTSSPNSFN